MAERIEALPREIKSLPADIVFYTEIDPDSTLLDCQPANITSVTDSSGTVTCTGVTRGSNCYCNFTIPDISSAQTEICFTAHATLYKEFAKRRKCIPVNLGKISSNI